MTRPEARRCFHSRSLASSVVPLNHVIGTDCMMIWPQIFVESILANEPVDDIARTGLPLAMGEVAFQAFYQETARPLRAFLYRLSGKPELADDLLQETYLRFLRAQDLKDDASLRK